MLDTSAAAALREQLASTERRGAGKPFPDHLRRAVVNFADEGLAAGGTVEGIARALGISAMSIVRWKQRGPKEPGVGMMRRVELVPEAICPRPHAAGLVVHTPRGLRIEGLTMDRLVQLVREIG